jgi:peptidyl-prolyl cis-trans isomerase A (cyclophilin A)
MNVRATHAALFLLFVAGCESGPADPPPSTGRSAAVTTAPPPTAKPTPSPTTPATAAAAVSAKGPFPESTHAAMKDPSKAKEKAPAAFKVKFETTAGDFEVECKREWAPNGVDRFYNLVKMGFFDDVAFFRVVQTPKPFVVQFGIHGNPEVSKVWRDSNLPPDPVKEPNKRGTLTYAMAGSPDTRSTQLFFNFADNDRLDGMGFAPVCKVVGEGMSVVDKIEASYGETPSRDQGQIQTQGNKYLREKYPKLDYIKTVRLSDGKGGDAKGADAGAAKPAAGGDAGAAKPAASPK